RWVAILNPVRTRLTQRVLAVVALLVAVAYPIAFALSGAELEVLLPFAIIPVGLAAWVFRQRVALVVAAAGVLILTAILYVRDGAGVWVIVEQGQIPTLLLIVVVALSIGFLRSLRDDLTQRASEAEALTKATAALVAGAAARETMQGILSAAVRAVPSVVTAFIGSDATGERLHVAATIGGPHEYLGRPYPVRTGVTGRAWRTGEIQRIADGLNDAEYIGDRHRPLCGLAVPIIRDGRTRGVLYFERDSQEPYTPRDVRILGALASYAWI